MKYVRTGTGHIAAFVGNKCYHITPEEENYEQIYDALRTNDSQSFYDNLVDENRLNIFCEGYIDFNGGEPHWGGVALPDLFTDRIIELVRKGEEFAPMVKFTINLASNPSEHSILELIDFLRNKNLPITKDGCFLAYKAVRKNYKDIFSGELDNSIGAVVTQDREKVDFNRDRECSFGLHVGALDYVDEYSSWNINRSPRRVIVKVNPKDVVSVPRDHNFQKLRTCEYTVLADFEGPLTQAVYDESFFLKTDEEIQPVSKTASEFVEEVKQKYGNLEFVTAKLKRLKELIKGKRNA